METAHYTKRVVDVTVVTESGTSEGDMTIALEGSVTNLVTSQVEKLFVNEKIFSIAIKNVRYL